MNKRALYIIFAIIAIATIVGIVGNKNSVEQACVEETCFNVEIANTLQEKQTGLSNRDFLSQNDGMLFPYISGEVPGFWMKDMRFPLDIIWISSRSYGYEVSGIVKDIQPCVSVGECPAVFPNEEIFYVLEINSGLSDTYDFRSGDAFYLK